MKTGLHLKRMMAVAVLALAAPVVATAQEIGVVASLTPQMQGQPPGQGLRTLSTGSGVVTDETIVTGASGRGQLLFFDESTLTVASNSQIVLDRFVYDPDRNAGEIGLTITRGALRFIGGQSTNRRPAEIVTPTGTIGVRGSSVLVLVEEGRTLAVFVAGDRLCFSVDGGSRRCTNRAGGMLGENGYLGQVPPDVLAQLLARIDGAPSAGGGGNSILAGILPNPDGPVSTRGETYDPGGLDPDIATLGGDGGPLDIDSIDGPGGKFDFGGDAIPLD